MSKHHPPLVAHIIYALSTGGLENGLINIINRTPAERYRHVIICITHADDFAQRISADGVEVIELNKQEGHDFGFYRRLWQLLRQLRPDIIHSRNLAALETQLLSIGLFGVKRVHGEHGREVNDLDGTNWKYLSFRKIMRAVIHRYIAVSKDLEHWLTDTVGVSAERVSQIYNGVDNDRFGADTFAEKNLLSAQWPGSGDALVIGSVGRLTPVKDQQLLLHAIALIRDSSPTLFSRVRLLLVGDGPLRPSLIGLVNELGLGDKAWLPGDREDIPSLLANMDVFVLPSLGEGISNTVLEAMAAGLPVIATAVGGNPELVTEGFNGHLVPVGDSAALADALLNLLENEDERKRLGSNARQRVRQRFDWNLTVNAYIGVYDELLGLRAPETGSPCRASQNL